MRRLARAGCSNDRILRNQAGKWTIVPTEGSPSCAQACFACLANVASLASKTHLLFTGEAARPKSGSSCGRWVLRQQMSAISVSEPPIRESNAARVVAVGSCVSRCPPFPSQNPRYGSRMRLELLPLGLVSADVRHFRLRTPDTGVECGSSCCRWVLCQQMSARSVSEPPIRESNAARVVAVGSCVSRCPPVPSQNPRYGSRMRLELLPLGPP